MPYADPEKRRVAKRDSARRRRARERAERAQGSPDISKHIARTESSPATTAAPMNYIDLEKGEAGYVVPPGVERETAFDDLVRQMLPGVPVHLLEVTQVRAWGDPDEPYKYIRCKVLDDRFIVSDRLMREVKRRKPLKRAQVTDGNRTFVAAYADLQIGKACERFGGTPETIRRTRNWEGMIQDRVRDLRRLRRPAAQGLLLGMGDTTEGCSGNPNYAKQDFTVDRNMSEQMEDAEEIHDRALDNFARLFGSVVTATMASNHDEIRSGGVNYTGRTDSRAFTLWRSLARAYSKNEDRFGHVKFYLPEDPNVFTMDLHGHGLAAIHGDLPKKGADAELKMWNWWSGQTMGKLPAGNCDILVTAHYHHHWTKLQNDKWMLGCPSGDGGSQWLTDGTGIWSSPGLLTFVVDETGVKDLEILPGLTD